MRVTLIHNPTAGDERRSGSVLVKMLRDAGHEVSYQSTKKAWKKALNKPGDLVVAAGGDGTVRKVALELAGSTVPLAVLPLGTANNVGKTVRAGGDLLAACQSWQTAQGRPFDLGVAEGPWGREEFMESIGGGVIGEVIERGRDIEGGSTLLGRETDRALHLLAEATEDAPVRRWGVRVDGRDLSGDYLAVEVLNIRFVGPNVPLAPSARPGDGQFDVVLVDEAHRAALRGYLTRRLEDAAGGRLHLPCERGSMIELVPPDDVPLHLDDAPWPEDPGEREPGRIRIWVEPGALQMIYGEDD